MVHAYVSSMKVSNRYKREGHCNITQKGESAMLEPTSFSIRDRFYLEWKGCFTAIIRSNIFLSE